MTLTHESMRADRERRRVATKLAGKAKCRCCGRMIYGNVDWTDVRVDVPGGFVTESHYKPNGTFGYQGSGICTLRCGFKYANRHAPEARR